MLILVGFALFLPGLLVLTGTLTARWPRTAQVARVFLLVGACGLSAMFAIELLAGRLAAVDVAAAERVLEVRSSAAVLLPLATLALGFFIGTIVVTIRMIRGLPGLRWPAAALLAGALLILAEIVSAQVVLSQVGNVLVWVGAVGCATRLRPGDAAAAAPA